MYLYNVYYLSLSLFLSCLSPPPLFLCLSKHIYFYIGPESLFLFVVLIMSKYSLHEMFILLRMKSLQD